MMSNQTEVVNQPSRHPIGPRRTQSRYVSEAFSFLTEEYGDVDEEEVSDLKVNENKDLLINDRVSPVKELDNSSGVLIKDDEKFTIITSVERSPQKLGKNGMQTHEDKNLVKPPDKDSCLKPNSGEKFTIVTYVEGKEALKGPTPAPKPSVSKRDILINPVYDADSFEDKLLSAPPNSESAKDENVSAKSERNSIVVEGQEVELRRSPNETVLPRRSRQLTWKRNQDVVSEAFGFLKDATDIDEDDPDGEKDEGLDIKTETDISGDKSGNSVLPHTDIDEAVDKTSDEILRERQSGSKLVRQDASMSDDSGLNSSILESYHTHNESSISPYKDNDDNHTSANYDINAISHDINHDSVLSHDLNSAPILSHEKKQNGGSGGISEVSYSGSSEISENDDLGELGGKKIQRRRGRPSDQSERSEEDGGSSDEDTGVYRESFRKSTWLYVGDNKEEIRGGNAGNYIALADLNIDTCDNDSIFGDAKEPSTPQQLSNPRASHKRNDSTATTASEMEFKNRYNSVSKRYVQRAHSQQEYRRFTAKFFDNVKTFTIEKDTASGYGIHLLECKPAVVSGVDEGSPAETAGVKEGQIVISVNGINVLESDHDEIIRLVQDNSTELVLDVGCGDINHVVDLQVPVKTGYLQKQVSSTIFRTWRKRYFILRRDSCLYYYKTEQDTDPLGAIPLTGYTFSRHGDGNKASFKAEKYNSKTFYFLAENRDEMTSWVGALNESAQRGQNKKDTWMDVTTQNVGLPALDIRKPDCSGYLYKQGRVTSRWRKRYCVLKDACIYHYKNTNSKEAEGVAHLHGYRVDDMGVSSKKSSFSLHPPEPQMRIFSFYTDNDTDKTRWVEALNNSIHKWVKVE